MTEYMVGIPLFSDRIYAGRVVRGEYMSDIRTDVTTEAINCVAEHLLRQRRNLGMDSVEGEVYGKKYRLTIAEIKEEVSE